MSPKICKWILITVVAAISALAIWKPRYNFDMLAYMAAASGERDAVAMHKVTFDCLRAHVPSATYADLTSRECENNPAHFAQQLPFYTIKPLYILAVKALHLLGFNLVLATVIVSVVSYWLLAWLLWRWIRGWAIFAVSSAPVLGLVRNSTPDCMALLIQMAGLYAMLKRKEAFGCVLLVVAIFCRPDAVIFAGTIFILLAQLRAISWRKSGALCVVSIASYLVVTRAAGGYPWAVLFYNSFVQPLEAPAEVHVVVTQGMYLKQFFSGLLAAELSAAVFPVFAAIGAVAYKVNRDVRYRGILLACAGASVIHYVLHPGLVTRLFAPMLLFGFMALVVGVRQGGSEDLTDDDMPAQQIKRSLKKDAVAQVSESADPVLHLVIN